MTDREQFEAWAKQPPMEWDCERYTENEAWPDNYRNYPTQCAWEGWQAARAGLVSPVAVTAQPAQAEAVPSDVVRDAERYRFIRDADRSACIDSELSLYAMESLDEYIDAAMEGEAALKSDVAIARATHKKQT